MIGEYFAAEGDTVDVGADFYTIDPDAKGSSAPKAAAPTPAPEAPKVSKIDLTLSRNLTSFCAG